MAAAGPTSPLSKAGDALRLALSRHLGALTQVWAVSLSPPNLTPGGPLPPSSVLTGSEFDWEPGAFAPNPQSVTLPRERPPERLRWDAFRGELAITGLDWSFAPRPGSGERIARQNPYSALQRGFPRLRPAPA